MKAYFAADNRTNLNIYSGKCASCSSCQDRLDCLDRLDRADCQDLSKVVLCVAAPTLRLPGAEGHDDGS